MYIVGLVYLICIVYNRVIACHGILDIINFPYNPQTLPDVHQFSSSSGHKSGGKRLQTCSADTDAIASIRYTAKPPSHLRSSEMAKSDVNEAGPTARTMDASN